MKFIQNSRQKYAVRLIRIGTNRRRLGCIGFSPNKNTTARLKDNAQNFLPSTSRQGPGPERRVQTMSDRGNGHSISLSGASYLQEGASPSSELALRMRTIPSIWQIRTSPIQHSSRLVCTWKTMRNRFSSAKFSLQSLK